MVAGTSPAVSVTVSAAGLLDAWIDFNQDGDWTDAGEEVPASTGTIPSIPIPSSALAGDIYGRRFSSSGGLSVEGPAMDGEVEDYGLTIEREGDLGVVLASSREPAVAGLTLDYIATITDHGPSDVTGVALTVTLPLGMTLLRTDPLAPTCVQAGLVVNCTLGALTASAATQATLTLLVDRGTTGALDASAAVSGNESDSVLSNDSTSLEIDVVVPLFADSFETGDTSFWSAIQPPSLLITPPLEATQ